MSDGCQNYDSGLRETRPTPPSSHDGCTPKKQEETKPPYFSLNYDGGFATGKEMDADYLAQKYKGLIPLCDCPHPKTQKACRDMYAAEDVWCPGCLSANKLLDVLANYEKLKIVVLQYIESNAGKVLPPLEIKEKIAEIYYYAIYE